MVTTKAQPSFQFSVLQISSGPYSPTAPILSPSADALKRVHVNQLKEKPVSLRRIAAFGLRPSNNTTLPIHNKQYEQVNYTQI